MPLANDMTIKSRNLTVDLIYESEDGSEDESEDFSEDVSEDKSEIISDDDSEIESQSSSPQTNSPFDSVDGIGLTVPLFVFISKDSLLTFSLLIDKLVEMISLSVTIVVPFRGTAHILNFILCNSLELKDTVYDDRFCCRRGDEGFALILAGDGPLNRGARGVTLREALLRASRVTFLEVSSDAACFLFAFFSADEVF